MRAATKPVIALTMGDPAGIGPEVILKAFFHRNRQGSPWLYVGDPAPLRLCAQQIGLNFIYQTVESVAQVGDVPADRLAVLPLATSLALEYLHVGQPDSRHAATILESIETACRLAINQEVAAIVTPPINKKVLHQAGFRFPGHTEFLGKLTGTPMPVMMLAGRGLRVVPATIHLPLKEVPQAITPERLRHVLLTTHRALQQDFAIDNPLIAVAGLNPHGGEKGMLGVEEIEIIGPVCQQLAREAGLRLIGPLPADTLFHPESRKRFHAVVCMYHDQALIPLKMLAFGQGVNITLGLPIVRTSVDHGTAYDIAGKGLADHRSLLEAVLLAEKISRNRLVPAKAPRKGRDLQAIL